MTKRYAIAVGKKSNAYLLYSPSCCYMETLLGNVCCENTSPGPRERVKDRTRGMSGSWRKKKSEKKRI